MITLEGVDKQLRQAAPMGAACLNCFHSALYDKHIDCCRSAQ